MITITSDHWSDLDSLPPDAVIEMPIGPAVRGQFQQTRRFTLEQVRSACPHALTLGYMPPGTEIPGKPVS